MDFRAYPGPLHNDQVNSPIPGMSNVGLGTNPYGENPATEITMSENLTLGLLGGLEVDHTQTGINRFSFNPNSVGRGPQSLNSQNPKRYAAYVDGTADLSPLHQNFTDDAGRTAFDTHIPEFLDRFPDRMPILYMRARAGANGVAGRSFLTPKTQYDVDQVTAYTLQGDSSRPRDSQNSLGIKTGTYHGLRYTTDGSPSPIGESPLFPTTSQNPRTYGAEEYLTNAATNAAVRKDAYILISAGADRYYGSSDDITNAGTLPAR